MAVDKNGNITISYEDWKTGIASHPTVGMGDIVNVDIFDKPGIAKIDYAPTKVADADDVTDNDTNAFQFCVINESGNAIIGSDEGDIFVLNRTSGAISENVGSSDGNFESGVQWKGYTIIADFSASNDRINVSAYEPTLGLDDIEFFFENMPTDSIEITGDYRLLHGHIIVGVDDVVYVASGRFIGSLQEVVGQTFDPTDSNTYTWNAEALDLPEGFRIDALTNLNDFLLISAGNPYTREQMLFPWDRLSTSFDYPTVLNNGVAGQVYTKDNLTYFLNGVRGNFSLTNRSLVQDVVESEIITLPVRTAGIHHSPNAITLIDDVFYTGISNGGTSGERVSPCGVFKIKDNAYTRLTLSNDNDGSTGDRVEVFFTTPFKFNNLLVGWSINTGETFGIDEFGKDGYRYTGYKAKMETPLYTVGTEEDKKGYQQIGVTLAKELSTGQGVRISYRENLSDDWTVLDTFDFDTYGAVATMNSQNGIIDLTTVQLKIELTTGASSTTSPELISVRLQ